MMLPMFILLAAAVFISQLVFCLFAKRLWIKLLPLIVAMGLEAVCCMILLFDIFSDVYGAGFAALVYAVVILLLIAMIGFGWGIYGIVKLVQKQRK